MKKITIGFLGLGLIGGSIARSIKKKLSGFSNFGLQSPKE